MCNLKLPLQHKKEEKERLARVGDWSEHVSSSGKKYYYNCRTEVSQWEKPPEWLEWERTRAKETSNRSHDKSSTRQGKKGTYYHHSSCERNHKIYLIRYCVCFASISIIIIWMSVAIQLFVCRLENHFPSSGLTNAPSHLWLV